MCCPRTVAAATAAVHIIIISVPVVGGVPIIKFTPAGAVLHFHAEITVLIIVIITVLPVFFFVRLYILIFMVLLRAGRGKINIIGSLTGFVSGSATAESCYC
jgi:hypothetical protein